MLAANSDDEILGCGGLIAKYLENIKFKVVFIVVGSSCRFAPIAIKEIKPAINNRENSALNALKNFPREALHLKIMNYVFFNYR